MLHFVMMFAATAIIDSVSAHNGAHVVIRHGAVQHVSGDTRCYSTRMSGHELVIDNPGNCSRDERGVIEVVTPSLSAVAVSNGGSLQASGAFPAQPSIEAAVEQGGTIDIRFIAAQRVTASVYSGGRIFVNARNTLDATIDSGGVVTYWGEARDVRKSVYNGGVVQRGAEDDAFSAETPTSTANPCRDSTKRSRYRRESCR